MTPLPEAKRYRWHDLPQDHPTELADRRRIVGERVMLSEVFLRKGCQVPTHAHDNEQFAHVISGELRIRVGAEGSADHREVSVRAGDVLHLPSNLPHSAEAVEDTLVLDIFSPPSEHTGIDITP